MSIRQDVITVMSDLGFAVGDFNDHLHLRDELGIDSTEMVEIVVAIERRFGIRLDQGKELAMETFGDLVGCVSALVPSSATFGG